jgi:alpha-tubulin suppressor-like RCC1 family protein
VSVPRRWLISAWPPVALAALTVAQASCGGGGGEPVPGPVGPTGAAAVASVDVAPPTATLVVGDQTQFVATTRDAGANVIAGRPVAWSTSQPAIATVSASGMVAGLAAGGPVTITATSEGRSGSATITVTAVVRPIASSISAGTSHTCALGSAGTVLCWGSNSFYALGQPYPLTVASKPLAVPGGRSFVSVSAGAFGTCALDSAGAAYCWGANAGGFAGATSDNRDAPTLVSAPTRFESLTRGILHACAITSAGSTYCWGNASGFAGVASSVVPVQVPGSIAFVTVSGGFAHTCAISAGGDGFCWGYNPFGAFGDGRVGNQSAVPVAVVGGLKFTSISAGSAHTCGIASGGRAFCWGNDQVGQLGIGMRPGQYSAPTAVQSSETFIAIASGEAHTCGLVQGGAARCWGNNQSGQLGDGSTQTRAIPVPVAGGLRFSSITAGSNHSCAVAIAGGVYCWGRNGSGELGDETTVSRSVPTAVRLP